MVLIARCKFIGNRADSGGGLAVAASVPKVTVFGSLVTGNSKNVTSSHSVYARLLADSSGYVALANTTVADNNDGGGLYAAGVQEYGKERHQKNTTLINSILSDADSGPLAQYLSNYSGTTWGHLKLQNSTFGVNSYYFRDSTTNDSWATLATALANQDNDGFYRYHSLNASGAETQNLEQNIDGDSGFLGSGDDPYQLSKTSNARNNGLSRTGAGFTYVDINCDGDYDALVDIIVAGTSPGGNHFVYKTDLLGQRRLRGVIDRGAYEWQPPRGTIVMFR